MSVRNWSAANSCNEIERPRNSSLRPARRKKFERQRTLHWLGKCFQQQAKESSRGGGTGEGWPAHGIAICSLVYRRLADIQGYRPSTYVLVLPLWTATRWTACDLSHLPHVLHICPFLASKENSKVSWVSFLSLWIHLICVHYLTIYTSPLCHVLPVFQIQMELL